MKIIIGALLVICILGALAKPAQAHQPRLVTGVEPVAIKKPTVSQAFYGTLRGEPAEFEIQSNEEFVLFISILVPDLPEARRDFSVEVSKINGAESPPIATLQGAGQEWEEFYEPFVADHYLQGPEYKQTVPSGTYRIRVSNPDNAGKYVLSVGEGESFTVVETIQTIRRLPDVKRFFNKSPWIAYFNLVGAFILVALLLMIAAIIGICRLGILLLKK